MVSLNSGLLGSGLKTCPRLVISLRRRAPCSLCRWIRGALHLRRRVPAVIRSIEHQTDGFVVGKVFTRNNNRTLRGGFNDAFQCCASDGVKRLETKSESFSVKFSGMGLSMSRISCGVSPSMTTSPNPVFMWASMRFNGCASYGYMLCLGFLGFATALQQTIRHACVCEETEPCRLPPIEL